MSKYTYYCITNDVCDRLYTKLHALKSLESIAVDMRNLDGTEILTSLTTIACSNVVVCKYLIRRHRHHTVVGVTQVCNHNDELSDDTFSRLSDINNYVKVNRQGHAYPIDFYHYTRNDGILELVSFFKDDSEDYRFSLTTEGHVTLNLCGKITPYALLSKMSFIQYVIVLFELPEDVAKSFEPYTPDLTHLQRRLEDAVRESIYP